MTDDRPVPPPPEGVPNDSGTTTPESAPTESGTTTPEGAPTASGAATPGGESTGHVYTEPPAAQPSSAAFEPPPLTAFAWRNRLVRPVQGRVFAGVSGAFARATNTDPVLWRVVLAVLVIFGGIGALIYLIAWLLLPADGDTASPIEALAGRGQSRTSTIRTIAGTVILVLFLAGYISEPFNAAPLLAILLLGGVLLLLLRDQSRVRRQAAMPTAFATGPGFTAGPGYGPTYPGGQGYAGGAAYVAGTGYAPPGYPAVPPTPAGAPPVPPSPFAPHGPFVTPPPPPPIAPPTFSRPPKPPKPRSRLGLLTFSVMLLVVGGLALVNLAGVHVTPVTFIAAALGVVGLGLLVGTWVGRSYGLIPLGIALTIALGGGYAALHNDGWPRDWAGAGDVTWVPPTVDAMQSTYRHGAGDATLDLSNVDFGGTSRTVEVNVEIDLGTLRIIVPPDVDVTVDATVDAGDAQVFQERWDGLGSSTRTVTNLGDDGPGGGRLHITTNVFAGELEVTR